MENVTQTKAIANFVLVSRIKWSREDIHSGRAHHEYLKAKRQIRGLATREVQEMIRAAKAV